jgi:hypothetical protein
MIMFNAAVTCVSCGCKQDATTQFEVFQGCEMGSVNILRDSAFPQTRWVGVTCKKCGEGFVAQIRMDLRSRVFCYQQRQARSY